MTRAEIESWLADYEFEDDWGGVIQTNHGNDEWPRRVAVLRWLRDGHAGEIKAAVAAEREACAQLAESGELQITGPCDQKAAATAKQLVNETARSIAAAIRSRSEDGGAA